MVRLLAIYIPVIAASAVANAHLPAGGFIACFISGLLAWTFLEYGIHRFAFHGFLPHWQHHELPTDPKYILAPLWLSAGTSLLLWALISLSLGSWARGGLVLAGIIAGYLCYEGVHIRIHSKAPGGPILRAMRKRHYYHHFADDHFCYGVVTPFWDRVFGSFPASLTTTSKSG